MRTESGFFKNIEIWRFILVMGVVLAHLHICGFQQIGCHEIQHLCAVYWKKASMSVSFFYIIAFFFLVLKTKPEQNFFSFISSKWIRLAPLFIVITLLAWLLKKIGLLNVSFDLSAELEADVLFVREFVALKSFGQFNGASWYCALYMLVAAFYYGLIKALPPKAVPLTIGIITFFAWRGSLFLDINVSQGLAGTKRGLTAIANLGPAYLVCYAYTHYTAPQIISKLRTAVYTLAEVGITAIILSPVFMAKGIVSPFLVKIGFAWLLYSFIYRLGWISRLLERDWCVFLGRYAYAIFATHFFVIYCIRDIFFAKYKEIALSHPYLTLAGIFTTMLIVGMLGHHLVEAPVMRYMKRRRAAAKAAEEAAPEAQA